MNVTLRPVRAEDEELLLRIYASTRVEELAPLPWTVEQKQAFVRMQFEAQRAHYATHYPQANRDVILRDGVEAGRLTVDRVGEFLLIVDIALLPEHRGSGIATLLIRQLQTEAASVKKPLQLHVEHFNRASRLYDRLGFQNVAEVGFYWLMEWRAPGDSTGMA